MKLLLKNLKLISYLHNQFPIIILIYQLFYLFFMKLFNNPPMFLNYHHLQFYFYLDPNQIQKHQFYQIYLLIIRHYLFININVTISFLFFLISFFLIQVIILKFICLIKIYFIKINFIHFFTIIKIINSINHILFIINFLLNEINHYITLKSFITIIN